MSDMIPSISHVQTSPARKRLANATLDKPLCLLLVSASLCLATPAAMSANDGWGGYFAGAAISHNWGTLDTQGNTNHIDTDTDDVWMLGLFGGHRWEMHNGLVAGLLIEVPLLSETGGATDTFFSPPGADPRISYDYDIDYAFLVTGQLGRSYGRWLPFIEAGIGMLGATYRVHNVDLAGAYSPGFVQEADNDHLVWKLGAGVDYRLSDNLVGGFKLDYIKSDRQSYEVEWLAPWPAYMGAHAFSASLSLAYRFD